MAFPILYPESYLRACKTLYIITRFPFDISYENCNLRGSVDHARLCHRTCPVGPFVKLYSLFKEFSYFVHHDYIKILNECSSDQAHGHVSYDTFTLDEMLRLELWFRLDPLLMEL